MAILTLVLCALWLICAIGLLAGGRAIPLVADDAYYYFEIARNAALGQGFTFDGLAPTNGFHPLWGWLLVPIFRVLPTEPRLPIEIAQALSLACMVATALLLVRLFARHGARGAGEIAAFVWLVNPFGISLALRGMEGPLNALLLMVSITTLDVVRGRERLSARDLLLLGATAGFAMLARTDNVLWLGSLSLVVGWDLGRRFGWRRAVLGLAWLGGAALVVVSPWLLWNVATFGTVTQCSVDAKRLFQLYGELPSIAPRGIGGLGDLAAAAFAAVKNLGIVLQSAFRYAAVEEWTLPHRTYGLIACIVLYAVAVLACRFVCRGRTAPESAGLRTLGSRIGAAIGIFFAAHFLAYAYVIGTYSNWYFLPPVLVACIALGLALGWVSSWPRPVRIAIALAHVVLPLLLTFAYARGHFLVRDDDWQKIQRLGSTMPEMTRVGLWNAGKVGYVFSFEYPKHRVINLDGVVNNEIVRAAHGGRYEAYVLENVDVVIEPPSKFLWVLGAQRADEFVRGHIRPMGMAGGWQVSRIER